VTSAHVTRRCNARVIVLAELPDLCHVCNTNSRWEAIRKGRSNNEDVGSDTGIVDAWSI